MELCTRNLFLLDRLRIISFNWRCWKDCAIVYGKKRPEMWSSRDWFLHHDNALPTRPWVCSSFWQKTWRLSLILPIHPTLRHATFSYSLAWKARWKENVLLMSAKWERKRWRSWKTSSLEFQKCFQLWEKKLVQVYRVKKKCILKETRVVIV